MIVDSGRASDDLPVEAIAAGYPVLACGPFDIYAVSPTYLPDLVLQEGNTRPKRKIAPKESRDIRSNYLGITPTRMPSCQAAEAEPRLPVFFIDGDETTVGFAGRPEGDPEHARAFVRIMLPSVVPVSSVELVPPPGGKLPEDIAVQLRLWQLFAHQDSWATVYERTTHGRTGAEASGNSAPNVYEEEPGADAASPAAVQECRFRATPAREVWISSRDAIELAEVRIRDASGRDVGSLEAGAAVAVSAQRHLYWFDEDMQRHLWRMIGNLGVKWVRENYYLTPLIWPHVERKRGVYTIDPCAMHALKEAAANGMTVTLTLGPPENPVYEHDSPDERVRAFSAYVRFLVRACGPRIGYFEVLNEFYNQDCHEPGKPGPYLESVREYECIALPAMKAIREERPDAKIILCGPCPLAADWIETAMAGPLAPFVDVISWHPYQLDVPPEALDRPRHPWAPAELTCYRDAIEHLVRVTREMGFRGEFHADEAGAYAIHRHRSSALVSAKYLARSAVLHSALRIPVFWNETVSLLRPAWQPFFGHPEQPTVQPDCSYYTLRTLCTIMDGMEPASVPCEVSSGGEPVECHAFTDSADLILIALWRPVPGADTGEGAPVDLLVRDRRAQTVDGLDPINGQEQPLAFSTVSNGTLIASLRVADYPLVIRLSCKDGGSSR